MSYIDKDKLLSSITREDFITIVNALGDYKCRKFADGSVATSSFLCHGGDSNFKTYFYPNLNDESKKGICVCMTCGDKYDLVQFVIRAHRNIGKQLTWYKALQWIAVTLGKLDDVSLESGETRIKTIDDFNWINRIKNAANKNISPRRTKSINENVLELFTYIPHEAWLKDGCSVESLDRFEIGYYSPQDCISIPHRDQDGRLIGVRCRNLDPELVKTMKYSPLFINGEWLKHALGLHLYGLWVTKDYIKQCGKIMIVESEKSCLQAYTMFGDKSYVAATCGSSISQTQFNIIRSLRVSKLIYAPDRDYKDPNSFEAEAWFNKQVLKLEPFLLYCQVYLIADTKDRLGYKDSPTDRGLNTFLQLYDEKIEITIEDVNRVKEERRKRTNET